jgi:hypothetical protein
VRVLKFPSQLASHVADTATLEARKLRQLDRGMIGLLVDNGSDGDFANLRITPSK